MYCRISTGSSRHLIHLLFQLIWASLAASISHSATPFLLKLEKNPLTGQSCHLSDLFCGLSDTHGDYAMLCLLLHPHHPYFCFTLLEQRKKISWDVLALTRNLHFMLHSSIATLFCLVSLIESQNMSDFVFSWNHKCLTVFFREGNFVSFCVKWECVVHFSFGKNFIRSWLSNITKSLFCSSVWKCIWSSVIFNGCLVHRQYYMLLWCIRK